MEIAEKLKFLLAANYRLKGAKGGRGGAKSWAFADSLLILAQKDKRRILCCRELQKSIKDSVHQLLCDRIEAHGWGDRFKITDTEIRCKNGSFFVFYGLRTNVFEIKSLEGIDICWIEEAEKVVKKSLDVLTPTIRNEGSEIWASWNTGTGREPIEQLFAGHPDAKLVHVDYRDNPWFPEVLRKDMEHDKATNDARYRHIWLGEPGGGGQFFPEFGQHLRLMPFHIQPHETNLYGSLDYGDGQGDNASATSFGLWHLDSENRPHRIWTYYKRHQDAATYAREIVAGIRSFYWTQGVLPKQTFADPSMFIKRRLGDTFNMSVADVFAEYGLPLTPANNDRVPGWRIVRLYFTNDETGKPRSFYWDGYNDEYEIYIPTIQTRENNSDDCEKGGEDHIADDTRYFFVAAMNIKAQKALATASSPVITVMPQYQDTAESIVHGMNLSGKLHHEVL